VEILEFQWKSWNSSGNPGIPEEILALRWKSGGIPRKSDGIPRKSDEIPWELGGNRVRFSGNPRKPGGNTRNVFTNFYFHVRRTNGSTVLSR